MNLLFTGGALFVATVIAHLMLWRLFRVKSAAKLLVILVFVGIVISVITTASLLEAVYVILLFGSLSAAYLLTMPAIESDSPSSLIVLHVHEQGQIGCTREDLKAIVTDDLFVVERLQGLMAQGFVRAEGDRFFITEAGRKFLRIFVQYHAWVGRAGLGG